MKILGLCGSLRQNSTNGFILKAAQAFFIQHEWFEFDLSRLPYFDPDNQFSDKIPTVVTEFRNLAASSDLIFISTPEYAHGVPGILKNALEWMFHEGTQKKPVGLVIASAQGQWTQTSLLEILQTMDFAIQKEQTLLLRGARSKMNELGQFQEKTDEIHFHEFCRQWVDR